MTIENTDDKTDKIVIEVEDQHIGAKRQKFDDVTHNRQEGDPKRSTLDNLIVAQALENATTLL